MESEHLAGLTANLDALTAPHKFAWGALVLTLIGTCIETKLIRMYGPDGTEVPLPFVMHGGGEEPPPPPARGDVVDYKTHSTTTAPTRTTFPAARGPASM